MLFMLYAAAFCVAAASGVIGLADLAITIALSAVFIVLTYFLCRTELSAPLSLLPILGFCAVSAYVAMQLLSKGSFTWFTDVGGPLHIMGVLWVLALFGLFAAIGGGRFGVIAGFSVSLMFGIANYTLELFRGRPLLAIDITSIRTAMNVAASYEFTASPIFILGFALAITSALYAWSLCPGKYSGYLILRRLTRLVCLIFTVWYLWLCLGTNFMYRNGIHINWDENEFEDSSIMYFIVTAQKLNVSAPYGYSADALDELTASIDNGSVANEGKKPTIIVIMSEAFSDLTQINDFGTNIPVTPFIDSLTEDTIRGYVYSSVLGGNTANSEYEFLTGDTMGFIPTGSVPYQLYVNYEADTLVSTLEDQGYSSTALHPYMSSGWNRVQVYDLFGFDNVLWKDDFQDKTYLRNYVTDESDYENLISLYEQRDTSQPAFFFNITMQNHGSYNFEDFDPQVNITGHEGEFPMAEQYLSLLNITDAATQELIEYFAADDEPVIVLFFGDHQPNVDDEFYDMLYGHDSSDLTLEEKQRRYTTPFFLWANYDIEEQDGITTSINYLSHLLLETAELQTTDYGTYLKTISEEWPAINANGVMDADGVWHSLYEELTAYNSELLSYRMLQYNRLFDLADYRSELFQIR